MARLRVVTTAGLSPALSRALRSMLDDAFDGDFSDDDWGHALGGWHVVALEGRTPVSHGSVVERSLEVRGVPFRGGYVEAVGTSPAHRGRGLGAAVMRELAVIIQQRFELGALATGAHDFYARLGWESWSGPTLVRRLDAAVRTPDDDDAVMVLRFGPSAGIDLTAAISCPGRAGDDW